MTLSDSIASITPKQPLLPVVHIAPVEKSFPLIESGVIRPHYNDHLRQSLAYYSYGHPAFHVDYHRSRLKKSMFPVAYIFDPAVFAQPTNLYACDSGAMQQNEKLYNFQLQDYRLAESLDDARRLIEFYYGDNEAYLAGALKPEFEAWNGDHIIGNYAIFIRGGFDPTTITWPDNHCRPMEISVDYEVTFASLKAVAGPAWFFQEPGVAEGLVRHAPNVPVLTYPELEGSMKRSPEARHTMLYAVVMNYYKELGLVSGLAAEDQFAQMILRHNAAYDAARDYYRGNKISANEVEIVARLLYRHAMGDGDKGIER